MGKCSNKEIEKTIKKEDCECENTREIGSVKSLSTGVVIHSAYECDDCGEEFVE